RSRNETGRTTFSLYYPAAEFWYAITAFPAGPAVATPRYAAIPGIVLEERTIVLPRTCRLKAVLLDPSGNACAERLVSLHVDYEDGSKADLGSRTDSSGKLDVEGQVRAAPFVLEIRSVKYKVLWRSQRLDGSAGNALELGRVVLSGEDQ